MINTRQIQINRILGSYNNVTTCLPEIEKGNTLFGSLEDKSKGIKPGQEKEKIIGKTKSGKPIYDAADHPTNKDFTPEEQLEAIKVRNGEGQKKKTDKPEIVKSATRKPVIKNNISEESNLMEAVKLASVSLNLYGHIKKSGKVKSTGDLAKVIDQVVPLSKAEDKGHRDIVKSMLTKTFEIMDK